jgi:hypothetical protein
VSVTENEKNFLVCQCLKNFNKMNEKKKKTPPEELATEWDLKEGMGILPKDKSFTQNIGCVGTKQMKKGS